MEDTNKDHIFTEIYIGIHCMMVLMVLIYYVYSQKTESIMTLILLDIDDFKVVNDVYGHLSGDYVIREVSQIIKKQLRTSDIGARYGGGEFAVLLPGIGEPFGQRIAERICYSSGGIPL